MHEWIAKGLKWEEQDDIVDDLHKVFRAIGGENNFAEALLELESYRDQVGLFAEPEVWRQASGCSAWQWWRRFPFRTPILKRIAMRVLSQTCSSSASERNWSTYDFILSRKRNRLSPIRAEKLVWVFSNRRLMAKVASDMYEELHPVWESDEDED